MKSDVKVYWNGSHIGAIEGFQPEWPNSYGKWVPVNPSIDVELRTALAEEDETGEIRVLLTLEGYAPDTSWIVSCLEDDLIDIRMWHEESQ